MDAQGRGRSDDIDPADQWVLNPDTGDYELRLNPSAGQSPMPGQRGGGRGGRAAERQGGGRRRPQQGERSAQRATGADAAGRRPPGRRAGGRGAPPQEDVDAPRVPGQRRRRPVQEPAPGRRRGRPKKKSTAKKALLWTGGVMAFVLVGTGTAGYLYYRHLDNNINTTDVAGAGSSGFAKDAAFNVLLIGTDKRTGKGNEGYGDKGSVGHADTNILLHVSKDRTNATALSIPRDLITDIPDCPTKQPDGSTRIVPGTDDVRFNTSLGQDGRDPGCTMRTVDQITGVHVDHFMMADFNAVKTLSAAVGGVDVCLGKDVDDPDSHLKLSAGHHNLKGEQALAFVRTRHSFGNEGDLDRIKVQQQFLGSLMRKMSSSDTLTSPSKLTSLAESATKALTVDTGIGHISTLKDVALELKKVPPKNITFTTLPVVDNPNEVVHATVVVNKAQADPLFAMLRDDVSLTEVKKKESQHKAEQADRLKGPKSAASDVRVNIYNGGAVAGSAQETLSWLQNTEGVLKSSQLGNAPANVAKTTLEYSPDQADQARELADLMGLPASAMKPGKSEENDQGLPAVVLTLGQDFKGAGVPIAAPSKAPEGIQKVEADKAVCAK
ncbi:LytR family transcriptional regulator [Streptomyces sulfonofaciens]|uniref:LytR family transcriptional regulator n=1 Tax=Streptomyces sulfonofaciens TaxID=68272 RepID=A0A919G858_9ACTN|nr:LCP family protein [Streptomyces sulfonofaciens]GHH79838.1 LytR family transcriptional regulator [Streptomyces sulfonofaciens]